MKENNENERMQQKPDTETAVHLQVIENDDELNQVAGGRTAAPPPTRCFHCGQPTGGGDTCQHCGEPVPQGRD